MYSNLTKQLLRYITLLQRGKLEQWINECSIETHTLKVTAATDEFQVWFITVIPLFLSYTKIPRHTVYMLMTIRNEVVITNYNCTYY